jgi:hypothetical protein
VQRAWKLAYPELRKLPSVNDVGPESEVADAGSDTEG